MHHFYVSIPFRSALVPLLIGALISVSVAHPLPDLPVRSHFQPDGTAEIRVEVDPRCFEADPEAQGYIMKGQIDNLTPDEVREMEATANRFIEQRLRFLFEPRGEMKPTFTWKFQKIGDKGDLADPADNVALVGSWKPEGLAGQSNYRLQALDITPEKMGIPLNVVFLNFMGGQQVERYAVLFPGETSFAVDLKALSKPAEAGGAEPKAPGGAEASEANAGGSLMPWVLIGGIALVGVFWVLKPRK